MFCSSGPRRPDGQTVTECAVLIAVIAVIAVIALIVVVAAIVPGEPISTPVAHPPTSQ
jgi:hypothetical protein